MIDTTRPSLESLTVGDPTSLFVFEPLRNWAELAPERIALVATGVEWTYGELESRTNRVARALARLGVKRGDRVAFVLPRGPEAIVTLLGILKAGGAYVPLDTQMPPNRIRECLEDAQPELVVVEEGVAKYLHGSGQLALVDELFASAENESSAPIPLAELGLTPTDLAYIIFTSGTTGRPKGVPIRHESLTNFVVGDQEVCIRVAPDDRVFQGFSPASDGHHEEVWPTFLAGATLVVATGKEVYSGLELGEFLRGQGVTIISCAPTLLSMLDDDVPTLRRILFGAESCPPSMVDRWWREGREILNTYGPTEGTVGATFGVCRPGEPITIGKPLPGYECYVLDDTLVEVEEGELCIAGVGISDGYYGRDDLTAARFVANPYAVEGAHNAVLYRTGDLVRRDAEGNLVWLGRIDSQVKIRGHRIELSEIEAHLVDDPTIKSAVVVARDPGDGEKQLAALLLLREGEELNLSDMLERLRRRLPAYMIPQAVETVERIPVLPSGKIDRRACEKLHGRPVRVERELVPPMTPTEGIMLGVWQDVFQSQEVSCTDDFFTDLGGYSLLASRLVSVLRGEKGFTDASVLDLYENPTIRSLAAALDEREKPEHTTPPFHEVPPERYRHAAIMQAIGVLVLFTVQGVFWLGPVMGAIYFSNNGVSDFHALLLAFVLHAISVPLLLLLTVATKWTVGGRFKAGSYPMWGPEFLRWWFVDRMMAIAPVGYLTGTPLAAVYLRMLGAKVGKNVTIESLEFDCPDLIEIGDDCSLENSSWIRPAEVAHGQLTLSSVKIGRGSVIGVRAGVCGGAVLEEGATLRDLTCVAGGTRVPKGEEWSGSPGRKVNVAVVPPYDPNRQPTSGQRARIYGVQFLMLGFLMVLDMLPFLTVAFHLYNSSETLLDYLKEPLYALALVGLSCFQIWAIKWLVLGKLKPGTYRYPGFLWLRKWFADKHLELLSGSMVSLYDTLFARPWCIALGMKCGPRCEIALPRRMAYDLMEMGEESFLASEVSIGAPIRRNGELVLKQTTVGKRSFLGNDSVVPQGTNIPDEYLLGVLSVAPRNEQIGDEKGQSWLGSPAFRLASRQVHNQFDAQMTYRPTRKMYLHRLAHEIFRIVLPSFCSLTVMSVLIESFAQIWNETSIYVAVASIPVLYTLGALIAVLICRLAKRLLIGTYRPTVVPLWSPFVWRAETNSAVLHDFGNALYLTAIEGTPFMAAVLRFMGAKIGKRAFINTHDFTEADMIHLGEDCAINANVAIQAHLFEDRVMKIGPIKVGDRCSVGCRAVVLCESEMKNDSHLGDMSLVMKGETIPSHTQWAGTPAKLAITKPALEGK